MKKLVVLSLAAAAVLFSGCGEETKKAAGEAATAVEKTAEVAVEETKEATSEVAASAKEKMDEAVEATKETVAPVVAAAEEQVAEATEAVKEAVSSEETNASDTAVDAEESEAPAAEAATEEESAPVENEETNASTEEETAAIDTEAGKALYVKCAACHGADGKTKALGKSAEIAGQSAADLEMKIAEYKAGTRDVAGMGAMMKLQVAGLSDEDIKAVSAYISTL
jgi:cytochrome c553